MRRLWRSLFGRGGSGDVVEEGRIDPSFEVDLGEDLVGSVGESVVGSLVGSLVGPPASFELDLGELGDSPVESGEGQGLSVVGGVGNPLGDPLGEGLSEVWVVVDRGESRSVGSVPYVAGRAVGGISVSVGSSLKVPRYGVVPIDWVPARSTVVHRLASGRYQSRSLGESVSVSEALGSPYEEALEMAVALNRIEEDMES